MKKITVKQIMAYGPCSAYTEPRVKELIGKGKTPLELCTLNIPIEDIFWVLFREKIIPDMELHELACKFAEDALKAERKAGREPHPDSWNAIKIKRQWMKGKATDEELSAAWAAWAAAEAAEAAWAARAAAEAAEAARAAVRKKQLKQVKSVLRRLEKNDII